MMIKILSVILTLLSAVNAADLVTRPFAQRQSICNKSVAFCTNACLQKTLVNFCDPNTMNWNCVCDGMKFPVSEHYYPVQVEQCIAESVVCVEQCPPDKIETCPNLCYQHYNCGNPNAQETKTYMVTESTPPSQPSQSKSTPSTSNSDTTATTQSVQATGTVSVPVTSTSSFNSQVTHAVSSSSSFSGSVSASPSSSTRSTTRPTNVSINADLSIKPTFHTWGYCLLLVVASLYLLA